MGCARSPPHGLMSSNRKERQTFAALCSSRKRDRVVRRGGGGMQKLSKKVLKIAIFREFEAAIGKDCRVLTRKKSGQRSQRLVFEFIDTTRTAFPGVWLAPLVEKQSCEAV